jgi:hypothetical protein
MAILSRVGTLLLLGVVASLPACASEVDDDSDMATTEDALTSTLGFHRFSGNSGAELTAWNDRIVVTDVDSVATYAQDPATTPGILNGTIGYTSSTSSTAFIAPLSGSTFTPLLPPPANRADYRAVRAVSGAAGKLFFVTTQSYSTFALERKDSLGAAPVTIATGKLYDVVADDGFVFTIEPGNGHESTVVRRRHDGTEAAPLGTFLDRSSGDPIGKTIAAAGGYFYAIGRSMRTVAGFGTNGRFEVVGPNDSRASVAASKNGLYVSSNEGLWRAPLGGTTATLIRTKAAMATDSGLPSPTCGIREEYGRNSAFTADASGVYVICKAYGPDRHVLLDYDATGRLRRRLQLNAEWASLGRLTVTSTHYCAAQQTRHHSSPKGDQLRCVRR